MTNIVLISRPRFWLYIFGPYIVGVAAGASSPSDFLRFDTLLFGLYFLLPANLLVYGINDIFDFETDRLNPKKVEYEMLVRPENHRALWIWIAVLNVPFLLAAAFLATASLPLLIAFILLSIFYSAPPIRAKEVSFLDSIFNVLYVFPGAFAYQLLSDEFPTPVVFLAGGLWTAAMHAYSAVPDIGPDTAAGVNTIATKLGSWGTHLFCLVCYGVAGLVGGTLFAPLPLFGLFYVALMHFSSYETKRRSVFSVYRWFPLINAIAGFVLFWTVAATKFF